MGELVDRQSDGTPMVVLGDGVVVGVVRSEVLDLPPELVVRDVMQTAPPSVRPSITAAELAKDVTALHNAATMLDKSCRISNYRATGREIRYTATCREMAMDYVFTVVSPDSYTSVATTHGDDPYLKMVFRTTGRRTGDACSAQELAQHQKEMRELDLE